MAANSFRLALLSTVIFSRFSSSPSLLPFSLPPSAAPWRPPQPTSASTALRSRGYSLMAGILDYASTAGVNLAGWNGSGTLFAPSDSAFRSRRWLHLYPTPSIFLYHTAQIPSLLLADIGAMPRGSSLPTLSRRRRCVFLRQMPAGELCVAESPFRRSHSCVKVSDPDLFHDDDLAIHGIDGVLDPSIASPCRLDMWQRAPHLDAAIAALRRKGYVAAADALQSRRSELVRLPAITVFAPRDLDVDVHGFREAVALHVVPRRYDLHDLARFSLGQRIPTIAANRDIVVGSDAEGAITIDSISVNGDAIYRNRWAVVLPVRRQLGGSAAPTPEESSMDSFGDSLDNGGAALGPLRDNLQESSNDKISRTDDAIRSDDPTANGGNPAAVVLPDARCHVNITPSEHQSTACTGFNAARSVDAAAITPFSDL